MFNTKTKPSDEFTVPSLADLNPTIAQLQARLEPLGNERAALLAEGLALDQIDRSTDLSDTDKAEAERVARVALALGRPAPEIPATSQERKQQIKTRVRDLDSALSTLNNEIATGTRRASAIARDRVAPEYRRLIGELAGAMISAHTAQVAINGLVNKMQSAGFSSGDIGNHVPYWLGHSIGPNSNVAGSLRELVSDGLLSPRDIPAELQHQ